MKEKKQSSNENFSMHEKQSNDLLITELANVVLEKLEQDYKTEGEPFEVYTQKLKSHMHANPEIFRQHFTEGYHLLMDVLHKPDINKEIK